MNSTRLTPTPVNLDAIPKPLTGRREFVVWQYVLKKEEGRADKWDKPPVNARTGNAGSHSNAATWSSFEEAKTAYQRGNYDGIGFVLAPEDPFFAIDLDHCLIDGELSKMARPIVERTRGYLYWEVSPSGTGLRGIGVGSIPHGRRKNAEFELYCENRYVTLTGHVFEGCDQIGGDASPIMAEIHREQFGVQQEQAQRARPTVAAPADDIDIIQRCQRFKSAAKFERLMQGSAADYGGDDSRADAALIEMLLFANQGDISQAVRIASTSMLWRQKWEGLRNGVTYIEYTAERILAKMTDFYEPKQAKSKPIDPGGGDGEARSEFYRWRYGGLAYRADEGHKQSTNFEARIVADILSDNGAEQKRIFEIEAKLGKETSVFQVPADKFSSMSWAAEHLGASAIIYPGTSAKEHARVGMQVLSGEIPRRREYGHTGWTVINGKRVYLTSTGAIGADGLDPSVTVTLEGVLSNYALPEPPTGEAMVEAIRSSLRSLEVAPLGTSGPIYCTAWRASLGRVDYAAHLSGQTNCGKSELTALALQHYGKKMNSRSFPAGWHDTVNSIVEVGFVIADGLLVADDYKPVGTTLDIARLNKDADRLFRSIGNGQGKRRMRADTSLREPHPVRSFLLTSGEDIPFGESLRTRMLLVSMDPESMDWEALSQCQADAAEGHYAEAMSGYIQWVARDPDGIEKRFIEHRNTYQQQASSELVHKRTPRIVADLAAAYRMFLDFATQAGALVESEATQRWADMWAALTATAAEQVAHHAEVEPTKLYQEYLAAAVSSGRAHIATFAGHEPSTPDVYGWRLTGFGEHERWQAQGERIGWLSVDGLYLEPKAAYGIAQAMAQRSGESLGTSPNRLHKTLKEKHLLLSTDTTRGTSTVRKSVGGRSIEVLHLAPNFLDGALLPNDKTDKTDNLSQNPSNHAENGMSVFGDVLLGESHKTDKTDNQPAQNGLFWDCGCGRSNNKEVDPNVCPSCGGSRWARAA